MITTNVPVLRIHELSKEQYLREKEAGKLEPAIYITPDEEPDTTLSIGGRAADAKAVGEALANLELTPGLRGEDGEDGISCTHKWNGTVLTVTSASGTSSADLKGEKGDTGEPGPRGIQGETGPQGEQGVPGENGYTPVKGVDYYTEEDKNEFRNLLQEEIVTSKLTISSADGSGSLNFGTHADSKIVGINLDGTETELIRAGGDTSNPMVIIGDSLYAKKTGTVSINAGKQVRLVTPNERVMLEDVGASNHSANLRPMNDGTCMLGTGNQRWNTIFAATSTIATSDAREKNNIVPMALYNSESDVFEILFGKLIPTTYHLNIEDKNPQLHIGFIAQDIAAVLQEIGMNETDIGFLHHTVWLDEKTQETKDMYGLRYEEFIALNTYMIQKLTKENREIKERLNKIEQALNIE